MSDAYQKLLEQIKEMGRLGAVSSLLEWDQETYMPPKGVEPRAEMQASLAAIRHRQLTRPEIGDLLGQLNDADTDGSVQATNVRETRRLFDRAVKLPTELVEELTLTASLARETWVEARRESRFGIFAPHLTKLLELKRAEAEHLGYESEPYDALLDEFEPGAKTAEVAAVFADLREQLSPVVRSIAESSSKPDFSILQRHYPRQGQEELARAFAEMMGFDFEAGRLDVSVHPFCLSMTGRDVRITTRYSEDYLPGALFGVMHEAGHGLYEQGLGAEHRFTPMGNYVSLGIHESQSRLWENLVGRSKPFWEGQYPRAQGLFPEALGGVTLDDFYGAINTVQPSLIRVEADEVTYNLHIVVRFELERALLNGKLAVDDIPEAWNQAMTDLVGTTPTNDAEGCLQDIHWSMGAFGYFPTYALGNLHAAHFFAAAGRDLPDLEESIQRGNLEPLRQWLLTNVHRHGMRYRANDLCKEVTGASLSVDPFMDYVNNKFKPIYGLT